MVFDSRYELTSKDPERGSERDARGERETEKIERKSTGNTGGQGGEVIV